MTDQEIDQAYQAMIQRRIEADNVEGLSKQCIATIRAERAEQERQKRVALRASMLDGVADAIWARRAAFPRAICEWPLENLPEFNAGLRWWYDGQFPPNRVRSHYVAHLTEQLRRLRDKHATA